MAGKRWTQKWHQDQITSFKAQRTAYEIYALLLNKVLEKVCHRHTQYGRAEARAKSVTSFAEKAIRKFDKYDDPIHMFTDLCGGRTVTFTQTEADRVCTFVRANFIVDEDNSEDVRKRLKPDQFGYRAIHYIVQMPWMAMTGRPPLADELARIGQDENIRDSAALGKALNVIGDGLSDILIGQAVKETFKDIKELQAELVKEADGRRAVMTPEGATMLCTAMEEVARELPDGLARKWKIESPIDVARIIANRKAEIQVHTALQNAWSAIGHDRLYKNDYRVPPALTRQMHRVAALLEEGDEELARAIAQFDEFALDYGAYMARSDRHREFLKWRSVLRRQVDTPAEQSALALKAAGFAVSNEDWDGAIDVLQLMKDKSSAALRELGRAKLRKGDLSGLEDLTTAADGTNGDCLAHCHLGEFHCARACGKGIPPNPGGDSDCSKAVSHFAEAFKTAPEDPTVLRLYLECGICMNGQAKALPLLTPALEAATRKSRQRADIRLHMPRALYDIGEFCLLLDQPYESLDAYTRAVFLSESLSPIEEALASLARIQRGISPSASPLNEHLGWVRKFLLLAKLAKSQQLATQAPLEHSRRLEILQDAMAYEQVREKELDERKAEREGMERQTSPRTVEQKRLRLQELKEARRAEQDALDLLNEARQDTREAQELADKAKAEITRSGEKADEALKAFRALSLASRWQGKPDPLRGRKVVIVVGTTDPRFEQQMKAYKSLITEAFDGFCGTITSAGTTSGVGSIVGDVQAKLGSDVQSVCYLPGTTPDELPGGAVLDTRYTHPVFTGGKRFSPLEPLQYWIDIVAAGVRPEGVKVLGIDGGRIAACEYHFALALGACVAVLEKGGREAARLLPDEDWGMAERLLVLPREAAMIHEYLWSADQPCPAAIEPKLEDLARKIHDAYCQEQLDKIRQRTGSYVLWDDLRQVFKDSNLAQARHYFETLRCGNLQVREVQGRSVMLPDWALTDEELKREGRAVSAEQREINRRLLDTMARAEHARFVVERYLAGWKWGKEKDEKAKTNPTLISWRDLSESVRELDRTAVRNIPKFLRELNLEVVPEGDGKS